MNGSDNGRLRKLETLWQRPKKCQICHGRPVLHVLVPDPADVDRPEYTPSTCPSCDAPLEAVRQLVGISIAEADHLFTGTDGTVHGMYCPARDP
jgi:hypothetical protein